MLEVQKVEGKPQYFNLILRTQAGTYIKVGSEHGWG